MTPQEMVERALALSKAEGCIVIAEEASSANLRWANNTLTTNGLIQSRQLTVIATVAVEGGVAAGVVSRSGVTPAELAGLVAEAEATARASKPAEDGRPLIPGSASSEEWEAPPAETSIEVLSMVASELGESFGRARSAGNALFGFAEHTMSSVYLGSSTGLRRHYVQPAGRIELNAKSADFDRSAWGGLNSRDFRDVDISTLENELVQRLGWAERRIELPPGRYETLLPPSAVADLMIDLYWSATARAAFEGRSVFSCSGGGTRVGEQLTSVPITLSSDPAAPGLQCAPFLVTSSSGEGSSVFDNGQPLAPTAWIEEGTLRALIQTRHTAELTGLPLTPWVDNLILSASPSPLRGGVGEGVTLSEMVTTTRRGLLLTCLWYIREVDPQTLLLTGLTRDGVYLVEDGEVVGAVNNFRFNESPVGMLSRILEVGATVQTLPREWNDYFTRTAMPPLRIADFNMSSVSQAL